MSIEALQERAQDIFLLSTLDAHELADLSDALHPAIFAPGETLMAQGAPPDGCYFVLSGEAVVATKLPGGGETVIAEIGPGSTLGEMALIRDAPRSASVRATTAIEAAYIDRRYFGAALLQLRPSAMKVLRQMALMLASRLRVLHDRVLAFVGIEDCSHEGADPLSAVPRREACSFSYPDFVPILPSFRKFDATDVATLCARLPMLEIDAGQPLFERGQASTHALVIIRGAVWACFSGNGSKHRINVLGPGALCGIGSLIDGGPHSISASACERAVCLELSRETFNELTARPDRLTLSLLHLANDDLAIALSRTGNHLTRVVGLSRIRQQFNDGKAITV